MINSKFNKQTGIIEKELIGDISLAEIINDMIRVKENKLYPRLLKIKANSTNANFKFSVNDLEIISNERNKTLEQYDLIVEAIIVNNPETTVKSMLYQESKTTDKYRFRIFSTDKGASDWLNNY